VAGIGRGNARANRTSATPTAAGQAATGAAAPAVSDPAAAGAAAPTASDPAATGAATPAAADLAAADLAAAYLAAAGSGDPDVADKAAAKGKTVTLRHTTPYKMYRRAGIVMTAQPKEYAVTVEQLADLKGDVWVEVIEK